MHVRVTFPTTDKCENSGLSVLSSELKIVHTPIEGIKVLKGQKGNLKEREENSSKNPTEAYLAVAAKRLSQAM